MDRIRRSFRDSFRRGGSKDGGGSLADSAGGASTSSGGGGESGGGGGRPQQWHKDEESVRGGTCNFYVKYLGCVEVFESRGMQVCEEALKVLRAQRRRPIKAVLYVSGDGLRVVDAENKGLLVDQTIEKVSFCAPDRAHEKGFAYICRDGTTRRWMCHGFHAQKETGERLSHAVGCAFGVCLEKKQKRDQDAQAASQLQSISSSTTPKLLNSQSVESPPARQAAALGKNKSNGHPSSSNANNNGSTSNFDRSTTGSFRQASLVERMQDPQNVKPAEPVPVKEAPPIPTAVARPHANPKLFDRQSSLRIPIQNGPAFRRHHSLRVGELESTILRQQQLGIPGARVSAIPEEDSPLSPASELEKVLGGINLNSVQPSSISNNSYHTNETTHWETQSAAAQLNMTPAHLRLASLGQSLDSSALSSRSKADEWLESTLQSTMSARSTSSAGGSSSVISNSNGDLVAMNQPNFTGSGPSSTSHLPPQNNIISSPTQLPPLTRLPEETVNQTDVFGQPIFNPNPPPSIPARRSSASTTSPTSIANNQNSPHEQQTEGEGEASEAAAADPFEEKWNSLQKPTNPFKQFSSSVQI